MNSIFFGIRCRPPCHGSITTRLPIALGIAFFGLLSIPFCLRAQIAVNSAAEFKQLAAALSAARLNGAEENQTQEEKALVFLDSIGTSTLNVSGAPDLDTANRQLAALVSSNPPVGENYRLVRLGGTPASYAMVVNFGLGGPAAVRIYAGPSGRYTLAGGIDHFAQKDFFDSDIELVPASDREAVFVTVSGRTDDLSTGIFSAWRFDGHGVRALWTSDLLQQSNYEVDANGFHLTYCGQVDEDHPSECLSMKRDLYRFEAGEWKRVESVDLPPAKTTTK